MTWRDDLIEHAASAAHPAAFNGALESTLARMTAFTAEQAASSAAKRREQHRLDVQIVLPVIVGAVLDRVRAGVVRSVTPAQIGELLDDIAAEVRP